MARGLTDPIEEPTEDQDPNEIDTVIRELIKGQNKLHDRIIDIERTLDRMLADMNHERTTEVSGERKFWKRGL
jgi:energy-coupling factor transporter ATP-binding protein EcfA2